MENIEHTGIIRKIDDLGRISVPKNIRKQLRIGENTPLEFCICGENIILAKYIPETNSESLLRRLQAEIEQALDEGFSKHIPLTSDYLAMKLLPLFETETNNPTTPNTACNHEWKLAKTYPEICDIYICKKCGEAKMR